MAHIDDGRAVTGTKAAVEAKTKALRVTQVPRGVNYSVSNITGTIAAALAANSAVFAMRLDPSTTLQAFIKRIELQYTTLVAYTTAVTAARRLAVFRGSGAATSGGTAIAEAARHRSDSAASQFDTAEGGDIRIATTGALTATGITFETFPHAMMSLTHLGAAGAYGSAVFTFPDSSLILMPGQVLAIRNPAAMDAAGTWQLAVNVDYTESPAYDSITPD